MYLDVNECAKHNGGCDRKRKCMEKLGTISCGNCPAGYVNDGAKGCKGLCRDIDELMCRGSPVHYVYREGERERQSGNYWLFDLVLLRFFSHEVV